MTAGYDADVALVLEGTYPYVAGGVSSWVHQILCACPERTFALMHIGPHAGAYKELRYKLPANVTGLYESHCRGDGSTARRPTTVKARSPRQPSRVLAAFRRLHTGDDIDDDMIADLASNDLSIAEFLHGDATFELLRSELYERLSPGAPFMDFFWHFRAMHVPLLRLLDAPCPRAATYHAVATGYAGIVGAVASARSGRPLVVTEHGIYTREREMELSRATWIHDAGADDTWGPTQPSPLRRLWSHYFRMLSRVAYHQATHLFTLSEVNRAKQLADGADPAKTAVVPNGIDPAMWRAAERTETASRPMRVGFVGRVVPIKDVITLIRACHLACAQVELEIWIVGPTDEDAAYAQRCRTLVHQLDLDAVVRFLGPQQVAEIYPQLDVVVLTSLSEGQPLVILEAYAAGLPVIATDVGACQELIEGGDESDRALGPSGVVTRVANPAETAAALVRLARHPEQRITMGRAGRARVAARYQLRQVVARYDSLYASTVMS